MGVYCNLCTKIKNPVIVVAGLATMALVFVLLMTPLQTTSLSNSSKMAKLQSMEIGAMLSMKIDVSADIVRNYSFLIAHLASTDLIPKENKRKFMLSEMEVKYKSEKALNNLWCTFEPNALDGMDADFINQTGSNELGIFAPWFTNDVLTISTPQDYVSDFYTIPKKTRQEAVSEPYWDNVNGEQKLMISFSIPVMLNDTFLGVLGTDFYINELHDFIAIKNFIGSGKLITDKGIVVIHDNPELIGKPDEYERLDAITNKLAEGKMFDEFYTSGKSDIYKVYVPVSVSSLSEPWFYIVEIPAKQIYAEARTTIILLTIIILLLFLSVYFYMKTTEKNRELKELHKVKDKMFSIVAHDLRSPITSLMSVLEMTHNGMLDTETQAQLLNDVSKRVEEVFGLLDNLLSWAKSQMRGMVIAPVYFDVQNEIRTIMNNLRDIAVAKMVALKNRTEKQDIYADRDMFSVVMRNLTINALKYTYAGGEVTVESKLSDDMLVVSVKDTGMGIPQEVQENLFKISEIKSRRGTNNESGTGLGLVLCADFVKANGGRIWFNSVQGKGSTFFFSVPVKKMKATKFSFRK